jgi:hypothetical protein
VRTLTCLISSLCFSACTASGSLSVAPAGLAASPAFACSASAATPSVPGVCALASLVVGDGSVEVEAEAEASDELNHR